MSALQLAHSVVQPPVIQVGCRLPLQSFVVASVTENDLDEMEALYKSSVHLNTQGFIQNLAFHGDIKERAKHIISEGGDFVIGRFHGRLIAMGGLRLLSDRTSAELCKLHVQVDCQGHGFGRLMCNHLLTQAAQKGLQKVDLHVTTSQQSALSLYKSLGFVTDKIEDWTLDFEGEHTTYETAFMSKMIS